MVANEMADRMRAELSRQKAGALRTILHNPATASQQVSATMPRLVRPEPCDVTTIDLFGCFSFE